MGREPDEGLDLVRLEAFAELAVEIGEFPCPAWPDAVKGPHAPVIIEAHLLDDLFSDREGAPFRCGRRQHALKPLSRWKGGREERVFLVDLLPGVTGYPLRDMPESSRREARQLMPDHRGRTNHLNPYFTRAIGADLDHVRIVEPGTKRLQGGLDKNRLVGSPGFGERADAHLTTRPFEMVAGTGAAGTGSRFISALIS